MPTAMQSAEQSSAAGATEPAQSRSSSSMHDLGVTGFQGRKQRAFAARTLSGEAPRRSG